MHATRVLYGSPSSSSSSSSSDETVTAAAAKVSLFAVSHLSSCEVFPLAAAPDYYLRVLPRFALPLALPFKLFFFLSLFLILT